MATRLPRRDVARLVATGGPIDQSTIDEIDRAVGELMNDPNRPSAYYSSHNKPISRVGYGSASNFPYSQGADVAAMRSDRESQAAKTDPTRNRDLMQLLSALSQGKGRGTIFDENNYIRQIDPGSELPPDQVVQGLVDRANAQPSIDDRRQPGVMTYTLPPGMHAVPDGWAEHGAVYDANRGIVVVPEWGKTYDPRDPHLLDDLKNEPVGSLAPDHAPQPGLSAGRSDAGLLESGRPAQTPPHNRRGFTVFDGDTGQMSGQDEDNVLIGSRGGDAIQSAGGPRLPRMGVTGGGMLNHQGGMIDLPTVAPGGAGMAIASADPNFVPTIAGTGETATPQKAEIKYSIWDRTTKDITPRAAKLLDSMASAGPQFGVTRIEFKAGKGPGHLSHAGGDQFDIIGYQTDGTKWTPEQRVAMASAARDKGATRFGFYPWTEPDAKDRTLVSYAHAGQGVLHVGLSGRGLPSAVWGADALTSGDASRRFTNPAEKAFTKAFDAGKPFDASSYVQYAATGGVKSGAPPADIPQPAADPLEGVGVSGLPDSVQADIDRNIMAGTPNGVAAAEARAADRPRISTLTKDDMNAEPPGAAYADARDRNAMRYKDTSWSSLPADARHELTSRLGASAEKQYEAMRATLGEAGGGGPPRIEKAPVQVASLASPLPKPAVASRGAAGLSARDIDIGTRTILGETGGASREGMAAVAGVLVNRAKEGYGGKNSVADVALAKAQFSPWNKKAQGGNDLVRKYNPGDPAYEAAKEVLLGVAGGTINSGIGKADMFHAASMRKPADWKGVQPIGGAPIGGHVFYVSSAAAKQGASAAPVAPVVPSVAAKPPAPSAAAPLGSPHMTRVGPPGVGHPPTIAATRNLPANPQPDPWTAFAQQKIKEFSPNAFRDLAVDGIAGPQTRKAIQDYQNWHGLKPDGVVGPNTWGRIAKDAPEPGFGPFPRLRPDVAEPSAVAEQPAAAARANPAGKGDLAPVPTGVLGYPAAQPLTPRIQPIDAPPTRAFSGDGPAAGSPPPRQIETRVVPVPAATDLPPAPPGDVRMGAGAGPAGAAFSTPPRLNNPDSPAGTGVAGLLNLRRLMDMGQMPNSPPLPSAPPPPGPATGAAATDPGVLGRAGGILTMLRQMAAGGGLVDPANVGLPSPSPRGNPRLTAPAVSPGGAGAPYAMQPAQPRVQAALRDMAFGSGAADAQPGAAFSAPQPGAAPPSGGSSSDAASAAAAAQGGTDTHHTSSISDMGSSYPPATTDEAIRQLQAAIDAMNSVENSATMGAY